MSIYKSLRGKDNLEKRLFLKTLVWTSLNVQYNVDTDAVMWMKPEDFFTPSGPSWDRFDMERFNDLFRSHINNPNQLIYSFYSHKVFGKLL